MPNPYGTNDGEFKPGWLPEGQPHEAPTGVPDDGAADYDAPQYPPNNGGPAGYERPNQSWDDGPDPYGAQGDADEPGEGVPSKQRRWGRRIGGTVLALALLGGAGGVGLDMGMNQGKVTIGLMQKGESLVGAHHKTTNAEPVQISATTPPATSAAPSGHSKSHKPGHDRKDSKSSEPNPSTTTPSSKPSTQTPTSTAKPAVPPVPSPKPKQPSEADCIQQLPTDFKINQMVMVGVASADITAAFTKEFAATHIGGLTVMTQPPEAAQGQKNVVQKLADSAAVLPIISTDQEGGGIERYTSKAVTNLPWADQMPALYTPDQAEALYEANYKYVKSQGVNMLLAPVADLAPTDIASDELPHRQYSTNPSVAAEYVQASLEAANANGMLSAVKHFPGGTIKNTDIHSATIKSYAALEQSDLPVFKAAAKPKYKAAVMVSNSIVPGLTDGQPASLSKAANEAAHQLGFKYTLTDALNAKAITLPLNQAVVKALEAGNNMALFVDPSNGTKLTAEMQQIDAFAAAEIKAGNLTEKQINHDFRGLLAMKQQALGEKAVGACQMLDQFKPTANPPIAPKASASPSASASQSASASPAPSASKPSATTTAVTTKQK